MAKYTTAIQGYYQGAPQIEAFLKKEIGTKEESDRIYRMGRQTSKRMVKGKSEKQRYAYTMKKSLHNLYDEVEEKAKTRHHRQNENFQVYAKNLFELFSSNQVIGKDALKELMENNATARGVSLFDNPELKWNSKAGAKAMKKFADMVLKNDQKKLEYYRDCLDKTNKPLHLQAILDCPTPVVKKATEADVSNLATGMKELEKKLNKTESIFHTNSPEFEAMKEAMKSVNQGLVNGIVEEELGSRLEALQAAAMKYVKTKGVGMQSSERGKERMDAALDLCGLSAEYMDFYTSKERRAELENFEKFNFGSVLSPKMENGYIDPVVEVSSEKENEEEIEV